VINRPRIRAENLINPGCVIVEIMRLALFRLGQILMMGKNQSPSANAAVPDQGGH